MRKVMFKKFVEYRYPDPSGLGTLTFDWQKDFETDKYNWEDNDAERAALWADFKKPVKDVEDIIVVDGKKYKLIKE